MTPVRDRGRSTLHNLLHLQHMLMNRNETIHTTRPRPVSNGVKKVLLISMFLMFAFAAPSVYAWDDVSYSAYPAFVSYPTNVGYSADIAYTAPVGYPANVGYPLNMGYTAPVGYPTRVGYPATVGYTANVGYP